MEIKQTSFRLSTDLLKRLRIAARRENRSLNNFVESALIDAACSGKYAGTVDTSNLGAFIKSCE